MPTWSEPAAGMPTATAKCPDCGEPVTAELCWCAVPVLRHPVDAFRSSAVAGIPEGTEMSGEDHDDWAKEPCGCGHARYHHMRGPCDQQREVFPDTSQLPKPQYPPASDDEPWGGWPLNWPPLSECPRSMVPCCPGFYDYEPWQP